MSEHRGCPASPAPSRSEGNLEPPEALDKICQMPTCISKGLSVLEGFRSHCFLPWLGSSPT